MENYLSGNPQKIDKDTWYYEEKRGIDIIHYVGNQAHHIVIPLRKLKATMARYSKVNQKDNT